MISQVATGITIAGVASAVREGSRVVGISLLGIPNDDNSSFMKGPSEAPPLIRRELMCDAYSLWSETGVDLGAPGVIDDLGDMAFDGSADPWELIERNVARSLESGR